jgi:hypothetical protein
MLQSTPSNPTHCHHRLLAANTNPSIIASSTAKTPFYLHNPQPSRQRLPSCLLIENVSAINSTGVSKDFRAETFPIKASDNTGPSLTPNSPCWLRRNAWPTDDRYDLGDLILVQLERCSATQDQLIRLVIHEIPNKGDGGPSGGSQRGSWAGNMPEPLRSLARGANLTRSLGKNSIYER